MTRTCVVKVGGSLLGQRELPRRLTAWLDAMQAAAPDAHLVLIAGGGKLVDVVRQIDRATPLGEARAHWISIGLMDVNARLLGCMLPDVPVIETFAVLVEWLMRPGATLLGPAQFMREVEPHRRGRKLPADWTVSSDSIAARLADILEAEELTLLKSVAPPCSSATADDLARLASVGYVDESFPQAGAGLRRIRCCCLPAATTGTKPGDEANR